jgi:2-polyprenyl-3-methyl-5-hydroxy-6-metoxy-1,4-benzoquinol methylase
MNFSDSIFPYLTGTKFSNAISLQIADRTHILQGRIDFLLAYCRGKRVLHLGCTDHLEIMDEKIKRNTWLHKLLTEVAAECIGLDNNQEALTHARMRGFSNVFFTDVVTDIPPEVVREKTWDVLVLGEIIEHIGNPVSFLCALRERYGLMVSEIVLTTPHAFRFKNFTRAALRGREIVNSDHRFWFTPYTLARVCSEAGVQPKQFWLVENMPPTRFAWFKKILLNRYPAFRDTLIMTGCF